MGRDPIRNSPEVNSKNFISQYFPINLILLIEQH